MQGESDKLSKAGFAACLMKPVRQSQIFDCLSMALEKNSVKADKNREARLITKDSLPPVKRDHFRVLLADDSITNQAVAVAF